MLGFTRVDMITFGQMSRMHDPQTEAIMNLVLQRTVLQATHASLLGGQKLFGTSEERSSANDFILIMLW